MYLCNVFCKDCVILSFCYAVFNIVITIAAN